MGLSPSPDPADDDGHRRQGRSPSPGTPAADPDDGGSGWGSDKQPTRAVEGRIVGKATLAVARLHRLLPPQRPPPSPPLLSACHARPGPRRRRRKRQSDARGGGAHRREGRHGPLAVARFQHFLPPRRPPPRYPNASCPPPSPHHQRPAAGVITSAVLSSPPGTPAPDPEDCGSGGSDNLTRAVSLLTLAEAGLTARKAGSAPSTADPSPSPPGSAVSSHHQDDDGAAENKRAYARFLVTHAEAGLIIGTGGSAVAAVEACSGARVKLSRHDELLPGTDRRVVLVSGLLSQVMDAMELLLEKLLYQGDPVVDSQATVVLVVPQPCCGVLIGKGGSVIKSLIEVSEAGIQVSPQNISYGLNDRLVTITGPLDNQLRAVFLIIFELLEDVRYSFAYGAATPNTPMRSPVNTDAQESLTIAVADEYMGAVIGRAGRIINEISKRPEIFFGQLL